MVDNNDSQDWKNKDELKKRLTAVEYDVTQNAGTERPFTGKYWNFFENGVYNCIVCNVPIFTSEDKFESHCGWPSFSNESFKGTVEYLSDYSHGMTRVEIRCKNCGAHLGHVFEDGPLPTRQRYCVNSASINFKKK